MTTFYIPSGVRLVVQELLDRASADGNQLYECDEASAAYYARYASTLKTESAYESLDLLDASDPLRGWGFYAFHDVQVRPDGLLVLVTDVISATISQYLLRGLVQPGLVVPCGVTAARAARSKLWTRLPDPQWAEQLRYIRLDPCPDGTVISDGGKFRHVDVA